MERRLLRVKRRKTLFSLPFSPKRHSWHLKLATEAFQNSPFLPLFALPIKPYGLASKHAFTDKMGSILCLVANLENPEGQIIWQQIGNAGSSAKK